MVLRKFGARQTWYGRGCPRRSSVVVAKHRLKRSSRKGTGRGQTQHVHSKYSINRSSPEYRTCFSSQLGFEDLAVWYTHFSLRAIIPLLRPLEPSIERERRRPRPPADAVESLRSHFSPFISLPRKSSERPGCVSIVCAPSLAVHDLSLIHI